MKPRSILRAFGVADQIDNNPPRPSWTEFWFLQALMYSTRGTCDRLRTACILVMNNRLVSAGYNGSPPGTAHCDDVGHLVIEGHCERTLHAEANAILNAQKDLHGAVAYVLHTPCIHCAKLLVGAGIVKVHFNGEYPNSRGQEYLMKLQADTGVPFIQNGYDPEALLAQAINRLVGPGGALFKKDASG